MGGIIALYRFPTLLCNISSEPNRNGGGGGLPFFKMIGKDNRPGMSFKIKHMKRLESGYFERKFEGSYFHLVVILFY